MLQSINDLSRSLVALDQNTTVIAVVELSLSAWLVGGMVPGIARDPLKKLAAPDPEALLRLLHRWRDEAVKAGPAPLHALSLRSKPAETASGWHGGWAPGRSKHMSFIQRVSRCHASSDGRRPIGWISDFSSAHSLVGCAARRSTAPWQRSQPWKGRMQNARTASGSNWLANAPVSSTA